MRAFPPDFLDVPFRPIDVGAPLMVPRLSNPFSVARLKGIRVSRAGPMMGPADGRTCCAGYDVPRVPISDCCWSRFGRRAPLRCGDGSPSDTCATCAHGGQAHDL